MILKEMEERAPLLYQVVSESTLRKREKGAGKQPEPGPIAGILAQILKTRCMHMSAWAHKMGIMIHHEGLSQQV